MSDSSAVPRFDVDLPWPVLRRSRHGHPVRTLQHLLRGHGHAISVDGAFGPRTESAVHAFQKDEGLAVDGIVGSRTWSQLVVTVRRGSRGDAVRGVQQEARDRELDGEPPDFAVDGVFGPATEAFVRGQQQALRSSYPSDGIAVDGIVGPVTWRALVAGFLLL